MMEKLKKFILSDGFRELVVYGIVGVLTTIINYVVYLLTSGPLGHQPGHHIGLAAVGGCSPIGPTRCLCLKTTPGAARRWSGKSFRFLRRGCCRWALTMVLSTRRWRSGIMDDRIAKLLSNIMVIILNYFASKLIIFKKK